MIHSTAMRSSALSAIREDMRLETAWRKTLSRVISADMPGTGQRGALSNGTYHKRKAGCSVSGACSAASGDM